ncbi:MAG: protein-disulfide reductase DsbD [Gammaproteobacteria bacterium]|nr:MAG: protein-disulfide reductase DsbD [Gammaproteobacteria bacterium]
MQNRRGWFFIFIVIGYFFFTGQLAFAIAPPLPVDEAFTFSASVSHSNEIFANWRIAPGYYLYTKRTHVTLQPAIAADIHYPQGDLKYDRNHTRHEIYSNYLSIPIVLNASAQQVQLNVEYQGCAQDGFCYPPTHKSVLLNLATGSVSSSSLLTDQHGVQNALQTQHLPVIWFLFTGLGLLLAFTPCVLPMIPIVTSIIVGQKQQMSTKKAFLLTLTYVVGMALAYAFIGLAAATMGNSLQVWLQQPWAIISMSMIFILLAFSLFGFYTLRVPRFLQQSLFKLTAHQQGGTYVSVFLMGLFSTFILSPCVTAPLVGVLMYIGQTGNLVLGASALFAMGFGMGLPLLLIGISTKQWLPKSGPWMKAVEKLMGVIMIAMAIWLASRVSPGVITPFVTPPATHFIIIRDVASLNQQLLAARAAHKPVMLDFYADWCESCVAMDNRVFHSTIVKQALKPYVLLRADLSDNTAADEALMKQYEVIAPPTVLFFDANGQEINTNRIIGEVNANEFLGRLHIVHS